ncbi:MAG: hypothetical protein ABJB12_19670 [Pseudomonadota bacterium]
MLGRDHSAFLSRVPLQPLRPGLLGVLLLAALAVGCTPKIGDDCTTSTDCSATGDRLCDVTEPGGYCTVFNCEPGSCPEDSACINFGTQLSPVNQCSLSQGNSPYQRSFCMATCSNDGDCRGGYACLLSNAVGGVLADGQGDRKVCVVKSLSTRPDAQMASGVCTGDPDAGPPLSDTGAGGAPGADAGAGAGADAGAAGSAGSAGSNEAGTGG